MSFIQKQVFRFLGNETPPAAGVADSGPFRSAITKTGGTPTVATAAGKMKLALDATAEVQVACLYGGDQLAFPLSKIMQVDFWVALSTANLARYIQLTFGLAGARSDDPTALTVFAGFRATGPTVAAVGPVCCRAYGGTPADTGDIASGQTLSNVVKRFTIDLANGVAIRVPPPSLGGSGNILFACDDDRGNLQKVCRSQQFDLSAYAGNVQLFAQIQKSAQAAVGALLIERIEIRYKGD